jgi:hypothetical protein
MRREARLAIMSGSILLTRLTPLSITPRPDSLGESAARLHPLL